jgi:hypothetical protein
MSITASVLTAGTNNYQTPAKDVGKINYWMFTPGVPSIGSIVDASPNTGDFAVQAQSSPNKTVKIKSGKMLMKATPTSEAERMLGVELSADYNLTIADNVTGSTKYDKIVLVLDADEIHNPPTSGDLTEVACLITERHSTAGEALTATNAIELAEVTVANGFSSIADTNISEKRVFSIPLSSSSLIPANETWTYASWDAATKTGTFTAPSDIRNKLNVGMRIRITQSTGGTKWGIITKMGSSTVVTAFFGTDYTLNNEAITSPYYSSDKSPLGFPTDPLKWTLTLSDTTNASQATPGNGTVYNLGSLSITIPIGTWDVSYRAYVSANISTPPGNAFVSSGLSTANNSFSDTTLKESTSITTAPDDILITHSASKKLTLAAATPYYLVAVKNTSNAYADLSFRGDLLPTLVTVESALL